MGAREREVDRQKREQNRREKEESKRRRDRGNERLKEDMNPLNPFSNWSPHRPGGSPFSQW